MVPGGSARGCPGPLSSGSSGVSCPLSPWGGLRKLWFPQPGGVWAPQPRGGPGKLWSAQPWGALVFSAQGAAVPSAPGLRRDSGPSALAPGGVCSLHPSVCVGGGSSRPPAPEILWGMRSPQLGWDCGGEPAPLSPGGALAWCPPLSPPVPLARWGVKASSFPLQKTWRHLHHERGEDLSHADDFEGCSGGVRAAPPPQGLRWSLGDSGLRGLGDKEAGRQNGVGVRSRGLSGRCAPCLFVKLLAD